MNIDKRIVRTGSALLAILAALESGEYSFFKKNVVVVDF